VDVTGSVVVDYGGCGMAIIINRIVPNDSKVKKEESMPKKLQAYVTNSMLQF